MDADGMVYIFNLFCVLESKSIHFCSDLLLNILLTVAIVIYPL